MPHIEIGFTTSAAIIVTLILVAAAAAFLFYRYTLPPVSRPRRLTLAAIRTAVLSLIIVLIFEPLARLVFSSAQPPIIAVLIDNSKSMRIIDRAGNRAEQLAALVRSNLEGLIPSGAQTRAYTFGSRWRSHDTHGHDSLRFDEDATDISAALRALGSEKVRYNIQAALIFTDGNSTSGPNPLYEAEQLALPLYTVGIGDSSEQKDLLITKVLSNDIVYNETPVPIGVTLKSSGFGGQRVEITLKESGKELARSPLTLESGTREYQLQFMYTPDGIGTKRLTVTASSLPDELTTQNNRKTLYVRVLKSKLRITMIAGAPSPDVSVIKQTFMEEKNLRVESFTQRTPAGFFEGQLSASAIDSADCIVLIGFPTAASNATTIDLLRAAFTERSKPLLFIGGKSVNNSKVQAILPVLPFTIISTSTGEQYVSLQISDAEKMNPILNIGPSPATDAWSRLPPVFRTESLYKAKAEATVLAFAKVQNIVLSDPLLLTRNVNRQKSVAFVGYGLWQWRLMTQGDTQTQHALSGFLANCLRWLTTQEDYRPVKVTPTKESYTQGEPVEFLGQVYDASSQPIDNAQLRVVAQHGGQEADVVLRSIGNGRYEGSIDGLGEGDYSFQAAATSDGQSMGQDRGKFSVGELELEFQDTRMNATLLRQLSYRTGGMYFVPGTLKDLAKTITAERALTPREVTRTQQIELWSWQYTLSLIILLLAVEWFLRKRSGML